MINRTLLTGILSAALATCALASAPQSPLTDVVESAAALEQPAAPLTPAERGVLGVTLAGDEGAPRIDEVFAGSPAEKAGLQPGDRIVSVGKEKIESLEALVGVLGKHQAGDAIKLGVDRDGWSKGVKVVLAAPTDIAGFGDEGGVIELVEVEKAEKAKAEAAKEKAEKKAKVKAERTAKEKEAKADEGKQKAADKKAQAEKKSTVALKVQPAQKVQKARKAKVVVESCETEACDSQSCDGGTCDPKSCGSSSSCSGKIDQKVIDQLAALGYACPTEAPTCGGPVETPCAEGCECVVKKGDAQVKVLTKKIALGGEGCQVFECEDGLPVQVLTTEDGNQIRCEIKVLGGEGDACCEELKGECGGPEKKVIRKVIQLGAGKACEGQCEVECQIECKGDAKGQILKNEVFELRGESCDGKCGGDCTGDCDDCTEVCGGGSGGGVHRWIVKGSPQEKGGQFWITDDGGQKAMIVFEGIADLDLDDLGELHGIGGLEGLEELKGLNLSELSHGIHLGMGFDDDDDECCGRCADDECCGNCDDDDDDDQCRGKCDDDEVEGHGFFFSARPAVRLRRPATVDVEVRRPQVRRFLAAPDAPVAPRAAAPQAPRAELEALRKELAALRAEIRELRGMLKELHGER